MIDLNEGAIGAERLLACRRGKGIRERVVVAIVGAVAGDQSVLQDERVGQQLLFAPEDGLAAEVEQGV